MNGVHDMGGLQNFGPVIAEANEPAFHHDWEKGVFGLTLAMGASRVWGLDESRSARESLPPAQYLASSYYEIWFAALVRLLVKHGFVTPEEVADGKARTPPRSPAPPVLAPERVAHLVANRHFSERAPESRARFAVGDAVRTRNLNPPTHTRLPRYCRGRLGTIARVHGVHVFPDTSALRAGENPQWLYSVRFEASELWGTDTTANAVYVDCFEPYLEAR